MNDGFKTYTPKEMKLLKPFPWKERELCDILEGKIEQFCFDVLWESYISHRREYTFWAIWFWPNRPKIDFIISCVWWDILLEVKNPINSWNEMRAAIWQSLSYLSIAKRTNHNIKRNVLLTTRTSIDVCETITELKLPIELLIIEEERVLILTWLEK